MNIMATHLILLLQQVTILRPCTNEWMVRRQRGICEFVPHAHELVVHSPSESYVLLVWSRYICLGNSDDQQAGLFTYNILVFFNECFEFILCGLLSYVQW